MKYVMLLLVSCVSLHAKILLSCGQGPLAQFVFQNNDMRVFCRVTAPSGGTFTAEMIDVSGGDSAELDMSMYFATNSSLQMDFQCWAASSQLSGQTVQLSDSGWVNVFDGDSIGYDCGQSGVYTIASDGASYQQPDFYQVHDVIENNAESGQRLVSASAVGFSGGCVFWAAVMGFSVIRSVIGSKEDI
jgi:hypothetical protein